jgi:hypothetical protein
MAGKSKRVNDNKISAKKKVSLNKKTISMDKLRVHLNKRSRYLKDPKISSIRIASN